MAVKSRRTVWMVTPLATLFLVLACFPMGATSSLFGWGFGQGDLSADFAAFVKWARENGVMMDGLEARNTSDKGVGLFATRNFTKNETMVSCPRSLLMTPQDAKDSRMAVLFKEANIPDCQTGNDAHCTAFLAMHLIHTARNASSPLAPWMKIIPRNLGTTVTWSEEELDELEGSNAHNIAIAWKEHIKQVHADTVLPIRYRHPKEVTRKGYSLEVFTWAFMTIYARAFDVVGVGKDELVRMVGGSKRERIMGPVVDLFNHGGTPNLGPPYKFDEGGGFHIVTLDGAQEGKEAFINYDAKNNAEYLLQYGFVIENNPHDYVGVLANLPPDAPNRTEKADLLRGELQIDMDTHKHKLTKNGLTMNSLAALRVLCASKPVFLSGGAQRAAKNPGYKIDTQNEMCVFETLIYATEEMIDNYPTSMTDDQATLKALRNEKGGGKGHERLVNSLILRIGEKRILHTNLKRFRRKYEVLLKIENKERKMRSIPSQSPEIAARQPQPMSKEEKETYGTLENLRYANTVRGDTNTYGPHPAPFHKYSTDIYTNGGLRGIHSPKGKDDKEVFAGPEAPPNPKFVGPREKPPEGFQGPDLPPRDDTSEL